MAVLARDSITIAFIRDITSVTWYYKLQATTASPPAKPTTNTPSGWSTTEPEYTAGSTQSLYICQKTVYTDSTFSYSDVSLSSSYEAAKQAYNKSVAAQNAADSAMERSVEYIVGTQTAATGTWTGVTTDSELKAGKTIAYKLPFAGSGNASLNLTLANGTKTGEKAVYTNTTRVTTHFGANSVITMTYDGSYWRANGAAPSNSNNYDRRLHNNSIKAVTAIAAKHLIGGTADGYEHLAASESFDLSYPILYASANIAAGKTATNTYEAIPSVDFSVSGTIQNGAANRMLYLKGSVSGNTFTVAASNYLTTTIPSSADNMYYIPLGVMTSGTAGYFATSNRLYAFLNGAFQAVDTAGVELANGAQATADENKVKVTELISDGANLMIGTTYPDASSQETLPRIFGQPDVTCVRAGSILSVAEHGFRVTNSGTGYTYITFGNPANAGTNQGLNGLVPGETYTISCDITCKVLSNNTNTTTYAIQCRLYDDHVTTGTLATSDYKNLILIEKNDRGVEKSTTERAFFTFKVEEGTTKLYIAFFCSRQTNSEYTAGDFIELRNLKLEKGKVATPWSSPMDWNSKIIAAANGRNKNSYITKGSDGNFNFPAEAVEGDQCFVAEHGSTTYTTLYRFDGTNWVDTKIGGMAVTQLDAGNITTGTLDATKVSMKQLAMYPDGADNTNPANASFFLDTTEYNATTNPYGGKFFWNMRNSSLSKDGKLSLRSYDDDYIYDTDGDTLNGNKAVFSIHASRVTGSSSSEYSDTLMDGETLRMAYGNTYASVSITDELVTELSAKLQSLSFYNEVTNSGNKTKYLLAEAINIWTREGIGTQINYDEPSFNGVFEVRPTSEMSSELGTKPVNGYYPMFTATAGFASLQLAGESVGGKLYWRGNQSGNKNLSGVAWRTILDSQTKPTTGTVTSSHTIQYQRAAKDALGNVDLYLRIALKSATSAWATIATLPSGYYPKETLRITVVNGSTVTIGAIANSGAVQLGTAGASGAVIYVQCHYNNS